MNDFVARDLLDGHFAPTIDIHKRPDNGHYEATSCGLKVTHHDQVEAVNRLTTQLQEAILKGEIHPGNI